MSALSDFVSTSLQIDRLATPEALWLFLLIPLVGWAELRRGRRAPLRFSSAIPLAGLRPTLRQRLRHVPPALRIIALSLLIVALARPQQGFGETRVSAEGVAIMAVVDRSWSMNDAMSFGGQPVRRIDVVKRVFREFVEGNGEELEGRPYDLVGLVSFARWADTICPPVRDHEVLADLIDNIELANPYSQRRLAGTAIGEGLALAAARLEHIEDRYDETGTLRDVPDDEAPDDENPPDEPEQIEDGFTIKSKIIVLLTDGDENMGEITAQQAAAFCEQLGIKIYAIGIGDRRGRYGFRPDVLQSIAERTGGVFRVASDAESLREVYAEIDELEKTEIRSIEHTSYAERWQPWGGLGAAALLAQVLLGATFFRRAP
jgi:Ca-activated chloride channel family protein